MSDSYGDLQQGGLTTIRKTGRSGAETKLTIVYIRILNPEVARLPGRAA